MLPSLCEALSAISALSVGLLVSHAESFLSHGNNGNNGNSLTRPMRSHFCYFCSFCGTLLSHADSVLLSQFLLSRRNKGNLCSDTRSLSAISAISAGLKTCQRVGFVLLSQRNEGNKGNSLTRPTREAFLLFLLFLRDNKFGGTLMSYIFMRDVPYLNQRCPISLSKMSYIVKQEVAYLSTLMGNSS